jgi:putative phosphoesterase
MKQIGIISDTHDFLDPKIFHYFKDCDEIWHAGDIGEIGISESLKGFKTFKAVYGNIDGSGIRNVYPEVLNFDCEGANVLMIHIGGSLNKYSTLAKKCIIEFRPDLFICGHSHILRIETDKRNKLLYLNPGAAGKHGFHHVRTIVRLKIENAKIFDVQVIELGSRVQLI